MGLVWNQRGSRTETTTTTQEGLPVSVGVAVPKKKWSNLMPLFVALVVIAEIAFLGRLDMAKNAAMVADLFYRSRVVVENDDLGLEMIGGIKNFESEIESCEEWLEREDAVTYSRDFVKEPVFVSGADQVYLILLIFFFHAFFKISG
jgi:glycoprotein 3-alpha-L-fucosyltransferase